MYACHSGSPYHPFLLVFVNGTDKAHIYNAELGRFHGQSVSGKPAVFTPDGNGAISFSAGEGLTTLDFRPLLERWERESNGETSLLNGEKLDLSGTVIKDPHVGRILSLNEADADVPPPSATSLP